MYVYLSDNMCWDITTNTLNQSITLSLPRIRLVMTRTLILIIVLYSIGH